jgi:hypothetical protein
VRPRSILAAAGTTAFCLVAYPVALGLLAAANAVDKLTERHTKRRAERKQQRQWQAIERANRDLAVLSYQIAAVMEDTR